MGLKILWTETAKKSLKQIFDYYKINSLQSAQKIRNQIIDDITLLKNQYLLGKRVELVTSLKKEYRFLISGNYKIFYFIENNIITISLIFDSRQSPNRIFEILSYKE